MVDIYTFYTVKYVSGDTMPKSRRDSAKKYSTSVKLNLSFDTGYLPVFEVSEFFTDDSKRVYVDRLSPKEEALFDYFRERIERLSDGKGCKEKRDKIGIAEFINFTNGIETVKRFSVTNVFALIGATLVGALTMLVLVARGAL